MTTTLMRGTCKESEKAKQELKKSKIEFREVFSYSTNTPPILITQSSVYSYKGFESIKDYCLEYKR